MMRVAVFGLGYVGCVTAACLSRDGHRVIGVDVDGEKVAAVNAGRSPVLEPGLEELIGQQKLRGNLSATVDTASALRDAEVALVAVGTPSGIEGSVETSNVERVVETVGRALRGTQQRCTVVIRSTLLPGFLEERLAPLLEHSSGSVLGDRISLCNNPEFLRETTAIDDFCSPPFVIVGAPRAEEAERVFSLYAKVSGERIHTDTRTAAMVKYACNAFHALKAAFANEIGTLAQAVGVSGQDVMQILCQDTRLNISSAYLRPGFAFGGSCLPKDVRALCHLAQQRTVQIELIRAILASNDSHLNRALNAIDQIGCRRIGLVGLSFKPATDDLRESPQVILAERLLGRGLELQIYDPAIRLTHLTGSNREYADLHLPHLARLLVDDPQVLLRHAELLVLATDVAKQLDCSQFPGPVLDLRRDLAMPG